MGGEEAPPSNLAQPFGVLYNHIMKLIAQLKLLPTSDQHAALLHTLEQANVVCNAISQTAWQSQTFKQFDVHTLVYDHIRAT